MGSASFCKFIKRPILIIGTNISKPLKDCRGILCVNIYVYFSCNQFVIQDCVNRPSPKSRYIGITPTKCNITDAHVHIILCLR